MTQTNDLNISGSGVVSADGSGSFTANATTNHTVQVGNSSGNLTSLATGSTGQVLQSGGASANPSYSTATYPSTAGTSGNVLSSDGTNWTSSTKASLSIVTGPASATDGDIAVYNGTTGKIIKDTSLSSTAPTFSGNVTTQSEFIMPFDNGSGQGLYTSDSRALAKQIGSGSAIYCFGNSGNSSITGIANTSCGQSSLNAVSSGQQNSAFGANALLGISTSSANTAMGYAASQNLTSGVQNCAFGWAAVGSGTSYNNCTGMGYQVLESCAADNNTAMGYQAGFGISSGTQNVAIGASSLNNITTGASNTALGYAAGTSYTTSDSSNISIGNAGSGGESHAIRIGTAGSGAGQQNTCFIAGINGVTVTGTAVLCSTSGQLGTIASSERYKENIVDMPEDISVMGLRPVKFNYKQDKSKSEQYGLIAEEVDKDFPYLCFYDNEGRPESVKYHELCTFLLKEVQRLNERLRILENK